MLKSATALFTSLHAYLVFGLVFPPSLPESFRSQRCASFSPLQGLHPFISFPATSLSVWVKSISSVYLVQNHARAVVFPSPDGNWNFHTALCVYQYSSGWLKQTQSSSQNSTNSRGQSESPIGLVRTEATKAFKRQPLSWILAAGRRSAGKWVNKQRNICCVYLIWYTTLM